MFYAGSSKTIYQVPIFFKTLIELNTSQMNSHLVYKKVQHNKLSDEELYEKQYKSYKYAVEKGFLTLKICLIGSDYEYPETDDEIIKNIGYFFQVIDDIVDIHEDLAEKNMTWATSAYLTKKLSPIVKEEIISSLRKISLLSSSKTNVYYLRNCMLMLLFTKVFMSEHMTDLPYKFTPEEIAELIEFVVTG